MGLLDDAIRQHLDLKRQHGADPSDVAKLEREAFGPIERGEAFAEPDAPVLEVFAGDELAHEDAELEATEDWTVVDRGADEPPEPLIPTAAEPAPAAESEPWRPAERVEPEPSRSAEPPERTGSVVFDEAAEHPVAPSPGGEHDELEETPEFLQETPEHDRLWFEQKPPRDFNF